VFVLDTNTLLDYFRGRGNVARNLLAAPPSEVALPAVAAYEVWVGVLGSRKRNAGRHSTSNSSRLWRFFPSMLA
jgi:tRNA(fMet)-specific endonuclease VapC